jgi:hypothetical protein
VRRRTEGAGKKGVFAVAKDGTHTDGGGITGATCTDSMASAIGAGTTTDWPASTHDAERLPPEDGSPTKLGAKVARPPASLTQLLSRSGDEMRVALVPDVGVPGATLSERLQARPSAGVEPFEGTHACCGSGVKRLSVTARGNGVLYRTQGSDAERSDASQSTPTRSTITVAETGKTAPPSARAHEKVSVALLPKGAESASSGKEATPATV